FYFFFQAEDGIRDKLVTGVQTCALPIYNCSVRRRDLRRQQRPSARIIGKIDCTGDGRRYFIALQSADCQFQCARSRSLLATQSRSEERRVGKEWRWRVAAGV